MYIIDGKAAVSALTDKLNSTGKLDFARRKALREALDTVNSFSPVHNYEEVRTGEWREFMCQSVHGAPRKKFLHEDCGRWSAIKENFCPQCGARMKNVEKENG